MKLKLVIKACFTKRRGLSSGRNGPIFLNFVFSKQEGPNFFQNVYKGLKRPKKAWE